MNPAKPKIIVMAAVNFHHPERASLEAGPVLVKIEASLGASAALFLRDELIIGTQTRNT
jgi:hypothetical protein